jgi:diacylglycerol kinase (ATP)
VKRLKKTLRSFRAAGRGIVICLCTEAHFRFHLAAVMLVMLIAPFYELRAADYAILLLTFAMVLSAEVVNTALERVVDLNEPGYSQKVAVVKDLAAGAVLVCAVFAALIGAVFFLRPAGLQALFGWFAAAPWRLIPASVLAALLIVFISPGPLSIYGRVKKLLRKRKD